ncbi:MAG: SRPBCC domain-containing protein [Gammaproteobacteria bacterium]
MLESTVVHDTFVLRRAFRQAPARVYAALADPAKKRRWFGEGATHDVLAFEMDFRVGGAERARYRLNANTPFPGAELAHDGAFVDIVPDQRITIASTMSFGDKRISAALVTFEVLAAAEGTTLICTHQAVFYEGADGPEMRRAGWNQLLDQLVRELASDGYDA